MGLCLRLYARSKILISYFTTLKIVKVRVILLLAWGSCFSVTNTKYCGPESNLDLVQFCWDYAERFNSIKYAMVLLPKFRYQLPFGVSLPRMICVRYYRGRSDGWRDAVNCTQCTLQYQAALTPMTNCRLPAACRCNICLRQPPSLRDAASHVLFRNVYNIQHLFHFCSSTTFNEYV